MYLIKNFFKSSFLYKIFKNFKIYKHSVGEFIFHGDLVFDIGAHTGDNSLFFLHKKKCRVVMVEPQPSCLKILHQFFANNKLVTIVSKGMTYKKGSLKLKINTKNPVLSTFSNHWNLGRFKSEKWNQTLVVPTTTLDDLIVKYGSPKYIKIDVEGYELSVLKGLTKKSGIISFEFTEEFFDQMKKCINYLSSLGYKEFNFSVGRETHFYTNWNTGISIVKKIKSIIKKKSVCPNELWGDVYCK
jgi:FkbM family methyltransferase